MKKTILLLAMVIAGSSVNAQLVSKKGEPILPQAGDWALGIEANPFLDYLGNVFGKSSDNSSPSNNFLGRQSLVGKYFVDSLTAYRVGLRIGLINSTSRNMVAQLPAAATGSTNTFPTPDPLVENSWKQSETNIGISAGMEWRRGKTRLQGYYGGELGIFYSSSKDKFSYGNALAPSTTGSLVVPVTNADQFSGAGNVTTVGSIPGALGQSRMTERNNGAFFSFGVRGFIGVEYFILPKISLGGEFGWGIGIGSGGKTTTTWESIGNNDPGNTASLDVTGTTEIETPGTSAFFIDTDNNNSFYGTSGALRLNFHF